MAGPGNLGLVFRSILFAPFHGRSLCDLVYVRRLVFGGWCFIIISSCHHRTLSSSSYLLGG